MPIARVHSTYRGMKRLKQIAAVFIRHGFYDLVSRTNIPGISNTISKRERKYAETAKGITFSGSQRTRMVFEELGPTFIKLGQMLSLEPDIIPADFVEEFKKLQDAVPPFSFLEVQNIIESELGEKPETLFEQLDSTPVAAASVSQVHLGKLKSGEKIVVKVQRPDIEQTIREDIKILKKIARFIEKNFRNVDLLNPVAVVDEFENFITKELDFTNEAANIDRFSSNFEDDPKICIPKVFWEVSTARVLVMEHIEGFEMDEVEKMRAAGLKPTEIAKIGLNCFARQILEYGFFHADPHPGNSIAMPDGRVALIDFGITGFIDRELMGHLSNIFVGYAEHDYDRVITVLINMDFITDNVDLKSFKYDLIDLSEPFYGRSLDHIQIKDVFDKVITLAVKYKLRLPRELILLFKTLIAMECMGRKLSPQANILDSMKPHALRFLEQSHGPKTMLGKLRHDMFDYSNIFRSSPRLIQKVLQNVAAGSQNLNMTHKLNIQGLKEVESSFLRSSNRVAMGLVTGTAVVAGALMLSSEHQFLPISIPSMGIFDIPIITLLGFVSYSIATILGIWLVLIIVFRSE
jgi:ubiquinone biosynthesis protein